MKLKYKTQITWAYWGGYITGLLYNIYGHRNDLPSLALCMRDFKYLRMVFGKYFSLLQQDKRTYQAIEMYLKFDSKVGIEEDLIGNFSDFMQGYSNSIKKNRLTLTDRNLIETLTKTNDTRAN